MIRHMRGPGSKAWLWKLALLIAVVGGVTSYYLWHNIRDADSQRAFSTSLLLTVVLSGICAICATSNWWMKR